MTKERRVDIRKALDRGEWRIIQLLDDLDAKDAEIAALEDSWAAAKTEVLDKNDQLARAQERIRAYDAEMDVATERIEKLEAENFKLAATQHDGYGDDHGNWRCSYQDKIAKLETRIRKLFDAIKHGDEQHQAWLKAKIAEHFALAEDDQEHSK